VAEIEFDGQRYAALPGESVLDCLLRHSIDVSYSCKAGACQSCLMQASAGEIPASAQSGLKDTIRQQGYFLACSCMPAGDLSVKPVVVERRPAVISKLQRLSPSVMRVGLRSGEGFSYEPGQFITLFGPTPPRSYSLASLPTDPEAELHVRLIPGGAMSTWLFEKAREGDAIEVEGPKGSCFYVAGKPEQPMLLAGTGTGLAPLYGIARDALHKGHTGSVKLFHGAVNREGLYLREELEALAGVYKNFEYVPVVLQGQAPVNGEAGSIDACIPRRIPNLEGWRAYVCGDPQIVNTLKKKIFLAGVAMREIYSDAFVPAVA
jgi:NAD(P)H-flavin reductase/ferredoxin